MVIATGIKIAIIKFASVFYFKKRSKVIFYHDIHSDKKYTEMSTPLDLFKKHIQIIRESGYEIVSEITKPIRQIEICFDDAFLGLYDNIELINKDNIPIHLFVISSYLDSENHIKNEQLLELNKNPLFTISSHTKTHKILNEISETEIKIELQNSKSDLERLLGRDVKSICFPEGKFNNKVLEIATQLGYKKQYSSLPGFSDLNNSLVYRSLVQFAKEKEFKAILKGGDHILQFWYKLKHFKK